MIIQPQVVRQPMTYIPFRQQNAMNERQLPQRLLLTGAAGGLGRVLRESLKPYTRQLRLSDIADLAPATSSQEEIQRCDLADKAAVDALVQGCDAIVHLGGVSVERPFEEILEANIRGAFNLYEAARRHGVQRVVFASSNHVIGFYPQTQRLDTSVPHRPDGYYGLSKAFGEDLASFYFDRYGIETVSIRIGSSFTEPRDRRMLSTWLSYRDLTELVRRSLVTPRGGKRVGIAPWTTPPAGGETLARATWALCRRTAQKSSAPRSSSSPRCRPMRRPPCTKVATSAPPAPSKPCPR